ncbi:MAG TPA: PIN domain-containing protein [Kiloniellales bacterium]
MKNNYILIDYENIQPKNLATLDGHSAKIFVFVGANQSKLPFDLASSLQVFGSNAKYIKIGGNGSNALDFHIAFYVGQLAERDPDASFHIISKDKGFDPLIKHMKAKRLSVQRKADLSEIIPLPKKSKVSSSDEQINLIVKNLSTQGHTRPRSAT